MDDIIDQELVEPNKAKPRVFSINEIVTGAFIGGSVAGGYMLAHNFKVFGQTKNSNITWVASILYTVILLGSVFYFSFLEKVPNVVFTTATTVAFMSIARHYQTANIEKYLAEGGTEHSWARTIGVSILAAIILGSVLLAGVFLVDPDLDFTISESTKEYGELKHEVTYNDSNISEEECDDIANGLLYSNYFGNDQKAYAYLDKEEEKYLIYFSLIPDAYQDTEVVDFYKSVLDDTESFSNMDVKFQLVEGDIYDVKLSLD